MITPRSKHGTYHLFVLLFQIIRGNANVQRTHPTLAIANIYSVGYCYRIDRFDSHCGKLLCVNESEPYSKGYIKTRASRLDERP